MKKILLSTYACIPNMGSEQGNGWNYAIHLSNSGLEVHCLTLVDGKDRIDPILAGGFYPNLTVHYVRVPAWVDKFCWKGLIGMYFHYLYWQWAAYRVARKLDQQHNFDLIHHATYGSLQLGSFLYKLGKPFIFGPAGGGQRAPKALKRYFGSHWTREWMRDIVGKVLEYTNPAYFRMLKKADLVIVTNNDTYDLVRRLRPTQPIERIWDVGMALDFLPREVTVHPPKATLELLWTGRMLPRKALELTIQALSKVDPKLSVRLTIVGGQGEMVEHIPGYIQTYSVENRVNWVGQVSYDQMKQYYIDSDVLFFTSLRDSCPHQLVEAMSYCMPILTLDLHGQGELVNGSNGIKVPVTNETEVVAALARGVEWMAAHPEERRQMGLAGYEIAKGLIWDHKIRRFVDDLYPALMKPSASRTSAEVSTP